MIRWMLLPNWSKTPKLMVHSVDDQIIPYRFGEQLFDAAQEPKLWVSTSGPHIRAAADPAVRQAILDFMQSSTVNQRW